VFNFLNAGTKLPSYLTYMSILSPTLNLLVIFHDDYCERHTSTGVQSHSAGCHSIEKEELIVQLADYKPLKD
jgi:hypothetical protein